MTAEEALALTDESIVRGEVVDDAYNYAFWEVVRKALVKQIPKKHLPAERPMSEVNVRCPICRKTFSVVEVVQKLNYCPKCGQRIDWGKNV